MLRKFSVFFFFVKFSYLCRRFSFTTLNYTIMERKDEFTNRNQSLKRFDKIIDILLTILLVGVGVIAYFKTFF